MLTIACCSAAGLKTRVLSGSRLAVTHTYLYYIPSSLSLSRSQTSHSYQVSGRVWNRDLKPTPLWSGSPSGPLLAPPLPPACCEVSADGESTADSCARDLPATAEFNCQQPQRQAVLFSINMITGESKGGSTRKPPLIDCKRSWAGPTELYLYMGTRVPPYYGDRGHHHHHIIFFSPTSTKLQA